MCTVQFFLWVFLYILLHELLTLSFGSVVYPWENRALRRSSCTTVLTYWEMQFVSLSLLRGENVWFSSESQPKHTQVYILTKTKEQVFLFWNSLYLDYEPLTLLKGPSRREPSGRWRSLRERLALLCNRKRWNLQPGVKDYLGWE